MPFTYMAVGRDFLLFIKLPSNLRLLDSAENDSVEVHLI